MVDLAIKNGRVVAPGGIVYGGVAVDRGRITYVGSNDGLPQAKRVIDAKENFVIPGLIDPHVHMGSEEDPSIEEGLAANMPVETDGALHGGITTFGHFVGVPAESVVSRLETTVRLGEQYSRTDFFLHAFMMSEDHLKEQPELFKRGVTSFKHLFNAYKPRTGGPEHLGYSLSGPNWLGGPTDEGMLYRSLEFTKKQGYPALVMVHCEEIDIIYVLQDKIRASGRNDLLAYTESRPNFVEYMRIIHAFEIARAVGAPVYVVHVSTAEGADFISRRRQEGYPIYGETGPSWLTHTGEMEAEIGCWGKVNPSLKYKRDNDRLWRAISDGGISTLGNDHGTGGRRKEQRERGMGKHNNVWDCRGGIRGGLEHLLPVMMTHGVSAGRISIEDLVRVGSTNTAKIFGLYPRKGVLLPGADADIVLVDPDKEVVVDDNFYHCVCEVSIYLGWKLKGMARTTIVRGEVMMEDYHTIGKPGYGRFVPCRAY